MDDPPPRVPRRPSPALRLGFRMLGGMSQGHVEAIEREQRRAVFRSVEEFARRTRLGRPVLARLARAGAFGSLAINQREALWHALGQDQKELPLFDRGSSDELQEKVIELPKMSAAEEVLADYRTAGLSLRAHPLQFLREGLDREGVVPAARLKTLRNGGPVRVAGIVLVRQRPGTAKGITFITLEDETGQANLIVRPDVWAKYRQAALGATLLLAQGRLQRQGLVIHVLVGRLENLTPRLADLGPQSRDFC